MLGLRFCARAFSSCGKRGPLFIAVRGPLTVAASLVAEHRLQTRRLSSCGSRAQLLRGMWDPPRPGLEPVSPALAGRFSTTAPPGKPQENTYYMLNIIPKYTHKYIHVNIHILYISIYLNTPVSIFFGQGFPANVGAFCPKDLFQSQPSGKSIREKQAA